MVESDDVEKKIGEAIENGGEVQDYYSLSIKDLEHDLEFAREYLKILAGYRKTMDGWLTKFKNSSAVGSPTLMFIGGLCEFFKNSENKFNEMLGSLSGRLLVMKKMKESFDKSINGVNLENGERKL